MLKFCEFSINYHTLKIIKLKASELFHKNSSISMLQNPTLLVLNFQARLWLRIKLNCRLVHRSEVNMIEFTFEMEYTAYIVVNLPQIDEEKKKFKRICRRGKKKNSNLLDENLHNQAVSAFLTATQLELNLK